jgi:histidyl-tRNA synthetase
MIYDEVFALLGLPVKIRYNNRKVLAGIAEVAGVSDQMMTMTISVDKLDKIGWEGVRKDLDNRGFTATSIDTIQQLFSADRDQLTSALSASEIGQKGLNELADVEEFLSLADLSNDVSFDVDLARGLNYYTGCIFEVNAIDAQIGSIGGGGRYDDLTSVFGLPNVSGVGISFGAERIYDVLEEKSLFPDSVKTDLDLLLCPMDEAAVSYSFSLLQKLRSKGLSVDMYPEPAKLKKQLKYVHTRSIPFAGIIGSQEMEQGIVQIKDMEEGNQSNLSMDEIIAQFAG